MKKVALLTMAVILAALLAGCAGGGEGDQTRLVISGISASSITGTGAVITWTTNEPATSQVEYGPTTSYGLTSALDDDLVTSHSVNLSALAAGTTYHYRVKSKDARGNEAMSGDRVFTTLVSSDSTPPTISEVTVVNVSDTAVTITWTTDEGATSQVEYSTMPFHSSVVQPTSTPLDENLVTSHSVAIGGLTTGTVYYYRVISEDDSGNGAVSGDHTFSTTDTMAPTITEVYVSDITESGVTITWTTDEPATSQVEYGWTTFYIRHTQLDENLVTSHSVTISIASDGTTYVQLDGRTYHFTAKSKDASGNEATSGDHTFTTIDTLPPYIDRISVFGITTSAATITWTTDEPATSQVEYGETIDYGFSTTLDEELVISHSVTLSGLNADMAYHFKMKSKDASGNEWARRDYIFTTAKVGVPNVVVVGCNLFSTWNDFITIDGEHNTLHIVGELRNDSSDDVRVGEITIRLYDGLGNVKCKRWVTAFDTVLRPGEITAFEETVPSFIYYTGETNWFPTFFDSYVCSITFTPRYLVASDPTPLDIVVQDVAVELTDHGLSITGSVFNADQQEAEVVRVYAVLYGEDGRMINIAGGRDIGALDGGESKSFEIGVSDEEPMDYTSYVVKAYGHST